MQGGTPTPVAWHALQPGEVLRRLDATPDGLTDEEAEARLLRYGPNRLEPPRPVSAVRVLLDQFASVVVLLLLAAAVVAFLAGDSLESAAIAAVLAINTGIGFVVELRARRAMEALLRYDVPAANVIRDGVVREITADELVPGDVIALDSGDAIPADARLLEATEVRTVEASLTGESAPVTKSARATVEDAPLAERSSMLFTGTTLASGQGRAVVVATGRSTEIGRIGTLLAGIEQEATPLERRLDVLGRRLVWVTLGIAAVVVGVGALQGFPLRRMVETGIALAIAAVPEGLPAVATIALAVGLARMARRNALVRRLGAVEALGSTTVVCTDKTGTLTAGEMTVTRIHGQDLDLEVTGAGFGEGGEIRSPSGAAPRPGSGTLDRLLRAAVLTNRAAVDENTGSVVGDPTDAALLVLGRKGGYDPASLEARFPRLGEIPFSSERKLSASIHDSRDGAAPRVFAKGAPSTILERCRKVATESGDRELQSEILQALELVNETWAGEGLRVIAVAEGSGMPTEGADLADLTFLGLIGISDPPATGVRETVAAFREAGIRTVMITGDQRATAEAIGRELGLLDEGRGTLDGRELEALRREELARRVSTVGAYSRVSPEKKLEIVSALQDSGEIVAMLGDGVNDAAALKKADVGVAMGIRGTDVAKQTAAIVLQDDRFSTIAVAVEQGRVIYDNIRKFVFYLFSCNLAEIMVLLIGSLAGFPLPLLPLQLLWLNLVTDTFPALALALEPAEPGVMRRPPRDPDAAILSRDFVRALVSFAGLITVATLGAYMWALANVDEDKAVTIAFMTLALAQLFHLGNARSHGPVLRPRRALANPWAVGAVPLVLALQIGAVYWPPLVRLLRTAPLGFVDWGVILSCSLAPAVVGQGMRVLRARRANGPSHPLASS